MADTQLNPQLELRTDPSIISPCPDVPHVLDSLARHENQHLLHDNLHEVYLELNKVIEVYLNSLSYVPDPADKLVVNLSDHALTADQRSLLELGLKFCPTPGEPDMGEIKKDLDIFH